MRTSTSDRSRPKRPRRTPAAAPRISQLSFPRFPPSFLRRQEWWGRQVPAYAGMTERGRGGGVRVLFFSGRSWVIRRAPYLVGEFGGVRVCSDLFRVAQGCSGCAGGLTAARFVKRARDAGRRWCGERGMVRHSCSGASVAGVGGSGVVPAYAGMTERGRRNDGLGARLARTGPRAASAGDRGIRGGGGASGLRSRRPGRGLP